MGLSRLSEKCRKCPFVNKCNHKEMEALAYLEPIVADNIQSASAPVLRETMQINFGGVMTTVYKDEIEKEIYKALREPFMLNYGA